MRGGTTDDQIFSNKRPDQVIKNLAKIATFISKQDKSTPMQLVVFIK